MNQLALMLTAYLALVGQPDNLRPVGDDEWQSYKLTYDKSYENQQIESLRRSVYAVNKAKLETKQTQLKQSNASYEIGVNKFTDQIEAELHRPNRKGDANQDLRTSAEDETYLRTFLSSNDPIPDEFDWRNVKNRVSGVKDQGKCVAGYAFATAGVFEGQETAPSINKSELIELSVQNLVDCTYPGDDEWGCVGGSADEACEFVASHGIQDATSYPYAGKSSKCKFDATKSIIKSKGCVNMMQLDESTLKAVLYRYGPIAAMIDAKGLESYKSGVFSNRCNTGEMDHSALIVGYGKDAQAGDFWILKNSWGEDWGEKGYFRSARGSNSVCVAHRTTIVKV